MIGMKELGEKSAQWGVPSATVDKDWVLGHFLNGIYVNDFLRNCLAFKGGTCLKKLYFADYRFSEDLDFTILNVADFQTIKRELERVGKDIYQETGISFGPVQPKDLHFQDHLMGYKFQIPFWGAKHPTGKRVDPARWTTKIKIDITIQEILAMPVVIKKIIHLYSDKNVIQAEVKGYSIEEIYAEKLRALTHRSYGAPRDYYDLWAISGLYARKVNWEAIPSLFATKCSDKKSFTGIELFFPRERIEKVKRAWEASLGNHMKVLPDVNTVLVELKEKIGTIFGAETL
ncbi:MAG TPA: nucleotidyl transferase AbiEii/AbiGii toxin family protein [Desulfobacterales bacterium]|nr:MAG: nucleotidyl transferase AbiEii/AbiGii toxin family protein [Deltaproteobacteria bacterium]HDG98499.1 nucleotidyl transferase AbiEii/AbiGii toxin family protein [Desulfobacterales bacterium]